MEMSLACHSHISSLYFTRANASRLVTSLSHPPSPCSIVPRYSHSSLYASSLPSMLHIGTVFSSSSCFLFRHSRSTSVPAYFLCFGRLLHGFSFFPPFMCVFAYLAPLKNRLHHLHRCSPGTSQSPRCSH